MRAAKRLIRKDAGTGQALRSVLTLMEADALDPRLRTHKLKGELAGCWSAEAGYDLQIVFQLIDDDSDAAALLLAVGTYDEVY